MSFVFSSASQLNHIRRVLSRYIRLPFSTNIIPGAFMEAALAHVRGATVLNTYDYVDVYHPQEKVGWSIKSTKAATPVTWKRAKIADKQNLIEASLKSSDGVQALGDAIINFCNDHAVKSLNRFGLDEIGYSRLIVFPGGEVKYFERSLCTRENPIIFNYAEFSWKWSIQKQGKGKEQVSALHGTHVPSNKKWWAWHGLSENQLHFSGEKAWWPELGNPHAIAFCLPSEKDRISLDTLMEILDSL